MADRASPEISVVLCVFNDWAPLETCLKSLALQVGAPSFEVVVIDDGSAVGVPDSLRYAQFPYPVRFIRQAHGTLGAARNTGIKAARGSVFLFTDADCILANDCLANLFKAMEEHPEARCFQLCLAGNQAHLVGKAEDLHLSTVQSHKLRPSGHMSYINTAGAAIRRSKKKADGELFDVHAFRCEDTMLLADLIRGGEFPRFVPSGVVVHNVQLNVLRYLWKAMWNGYVTGRMYEARQAVRAGIHASMPQRMQMLWAMWRKCVAHGWGPYPFLIVAMKQGLSLAGSLAYRCLNRPSENRLFRDDRPAACRL